MLPGPIAKIWVATCVATSKTRAAAVVTLEKEIRILRAGVKLTKFSGQSYAILPAATAGQKVRRDSGRNVSIRSQQGLCPQFAVLVDPTMTLTSTSTSSNFEDGN